MNEIKRLTPVERKAFREHASRNRQPTPSEPALGTLNERLRILAIRHGIRVGAIVLTKEERAQIAAARVSP